MNDAGIFCGSEARSEKGGFSMKVSIVLWRNKAILKEIEDYLMKNFVLTE